MAVFKFVISHKQKSYQIEKDQKDSPVFGKKIGETFSADFLGLDGYELQVTGGSDKDGFPMRKDVEGTMRRKIITTYGVGMRSKIGGMRRRRTLRGNLIAEDIAQINCRVTKEGSTALDSVLGKEKKEESKAEEK